jgi:chlorobactene glucosyltransferase
VVLVYALVGLMVLAVMGWAALLAYNVAKMRGAPRLTSRDAARFPSDAPLVSILVPARNEASRILERAVRSMAAQDYPNFEVVVVDDCSTDDTYAIVEAIARSEPRVRAVRGAALPQGWAGKPWALEQAKRHARGTWILATDADIVFAPEAVRAAMSAAFRGRLDALTLLPDVGAGGFWTRAVMPVAAWMISVVFPIDKTNDPNSGVALGCGGFFLMRREAHDAAGGYEAIRAEVVDDVATAQALKSHGRRLRIEGAQELLHTPMYDTLGELWLGFSRNAFAGASRSVWVVAYSSLANVLATGLPTVIAVAGLALWLGFGVAAARPVALAALAAYVAMVASFVPVYRALGGRPHYAPLAGVANLVMVAILLDSTYRALSGRAVVWRGQRIAIERGR